MIEKPKVSIINMSQVFNDRVIVLLVIRSLLLRARENCRNGAFVVLTMDTVDGESAPLILLRVR